MLIGGKYTYSSEFENDYLDGGEGAGRMYGGNADEKEGIEDVSYCKLILISMENSQQETDETELNKRFFRSEILTYSHQREQEKCA